ncbi:MAG: ABC transporter ATP-binding protein [Thermofilum sp. ex4484_15]|nr:MAG: ABC transporter ATP-binding protein [Thermofilum sp. ex4484_15]
MSIEDRSEYLVETRNLIKRFGDVIALRNVNFRVGYNEVVGLVGDNGAGKSTLVKTITGTYAPDGGEIWIKGRRFKRITPKIAKALGVEIVHQERTIAENQPIWRNIFMGRELTNSLGFLKIREMEEATMKLIKEMGFKSEIIYPGKLARTLSGGYKQGVQIARALYFKADLVILDEPTIQLSLSEVNRVLEFVKDLKKRGKSCVFITHNIYHVYPVADRFAIMDRGRIVAEFWKSDLSIEDLSNILVTIARTGTIPVEYREINLVSRPLEYASS